MSVLFMLLIVIVVIQKMFSTTYNQQYTTPGTYTMMIPINTAGVTMGCKN